MSEWLDFFKDEETKRLAALIINRERSHKHVTSPFTIQALSHRPNDIKAVIVGENCPEDCPGAVVFNVGAEDPLWEKLTSRIINFIDIKSEHTAFVALGDKASKIIRHVSPNHTYLRLPESHPNISNLIRLLTFTK